MCIPDHDNGEMMMQGQGCPLLMQALSAPNHDDDDAGARGGLCQRELHAVCTSNQTNNSEPGTTSKTG